MRRKPVEAGLRISKLAVTLAACAAARGTLGAAPPIVLTVNPGLPAGSGNFTTIQAAVNSVPAGNLQPYTINISPGTYDERVLVPSGKEYVTLKGVGADRSQVVLTAFDWMGGANGWEGSQPLRAYANNFRAENLTLQNTWGDNGQATALRTAGDKQVFENVVLDGWQDTFLAQGGRQYFHNSEIRGRVDFIYGPANVVFENSNIVSRNGGHVTAASTPSANPYGFTFISSTLNWDHSQAYAQADLGRPWDPYASVAYINTWMDSHIKAVGWDNWGDPANEATARYVEYNTTGPGANPGGRVGWSHQLSAAQAAAYNTANIFNGWSPLTTPMVPVSWSGGNANWNSAGNWDSNAAPLAGQNLYILPSASATVTVDMLAIGDQLTLGKTGVPSTINISATGHLNITGALFLAGASTININGGSLTVPTINVPTANEQDRIYIKNGGHLNITNWTGGWGPAGSLYINNGAFSSTSLDGVQIVMAPVAGDIATVTINSTDSWAKVRYLETGDGTSVFQMNGGAIAGVYGPYFGTQGSGTGTATWNMKGGVATFIDPTLGKSKGGTFFVNQTGGTVNNVAGFGSQSFNDGIITIAGNSNSSGTWTMSQVDGTPIINHRGMVVGNSGNGRFIQTAGSVTFNQTQVASTKGQGLKIAIGSGTGLYQISGNSTLNVQNYGFTIGYKTDGTAATGRGTFKVIGGQPRVSVVGDYRQNTNSMLAGQLTSTGLASIAINGNVSFAAGALVDLSNDYDASAGSFTLMNWTGTSTGAPTFASGVDTFAWSVNLDAAGKALRATYAPVASSQWNLNGDGSWSTPSNWTTGVPMATNSVANFGSIISSARQITNPTQRALGAINFDSASGYTLAGPAAILMSVTSGPASINVQNGSHTIAAPLTLVSDTTFNVAPAGGLLKVTGPLSATDRTINKSGSGIAQFENLRAAALNVITGTVRVSPKATPNDPTGTGKLASLAITSGATLDLSNNSLVIDYSGAIGSLLDDVRNYLQTGRIIGSAIGYADNTITGLSTFAGQPVDSTSLLLKSTYLGDSNLDGQVNIRDLQLLASHWGTGGVWSDGDFNYDGVVDSRDLGIIASNWQAGVGSPPGPGSFAAALASVPEPAVLGVIAFALPLLLRRRRNGDYRQPV